MAETKVQGVETFARTEFWGEVTTARRPVDLDMAIEMLTHPSAITETLHWGRNYLYGAELDAGGETLEVAVKQFRNRGLRAQLERRLKGSKAERSWRGALALQAAEIPTAEAVMLIESRQPQGPSYFVSRRLRDFLEARYYFRALEAHRELEEFPGFEADRVMEAMGRSIRRLHDAGIWHRDLSVGNLLFQRVEEPGGPIEVIFVDLNRVRLKSRLTTLQRTRDLCRLRIFRPAHQERFLRTYWGEESRSPWRKRLLYRLMFRGFLFKVWAKTMSRNSFGGLRDRVLPRRAYEHIPRAPDETSARDRAVWDPLSDQPHQHATRAQRLAVRLADAPLHGRELAAGLGALPRVRRRYRELKSQLYRQPVLWQGMGIAVRPWSQRPEALLKALDRIGTRSVLLRLHPWQERHDPEEELAEELHQRGYEIVFSLPQNRALVRDLERWRAAVSELAERFGRFGRHFQVGQAINRSKWGIWNHREYLDLAAAAAEILRQDEERRLLGPAVIDYEPLRTAGILNIPRQGTYFDILASLLYVDRRGAPENSQLGFDTVDKIVQLKAIAETATNCGDRSWITETNWPLWEGPHSPAGRKVAVDEGSQADYLVRYYLLGLGTGLVERVYWWQLIARGYGLSHDDGAGGLRLRPSFAAFANLHRHLEGATFLGPVDTAPPGRLYGFQCADEGQIMVGWSATDTPIRARLPRSVQRVVDRDGQELPVPRGTEIDLDGSPRYFWLDSG